MSALERLADVWRRARRVVVLTGAGLSTASGIPDFRSPGGRWERYQPVPLPEFLASERARETYWRYKGETWQLICAAAPNAAHLALADLARAGRVDLLVTQNVDGLHERAGFPPERLVNIHGTDSAVECMACHRRAARAVAQEAWEAGTARRAHQPDVPRGVWWGRAHRDRDRLGDALRRRDRRAAGRAGGARAAGAAGSPRVRRAPFGPTGVSVPVVGQGTWNMERDDRAAAVAALRAGLDAGLTHVDTAELYGSGRVEELVGEAIAGRRDEVFLVSKVLPQNASRAGVPRACEASLRRLRTDRLDCYLLHWPGRHPLADTIAAFERLQREGKIRGWGVSNFAVEELERAAAIAGAERIACNQVLHHLEERSIEHAVVPWCRARGTAVVGYSPFGSGRFPGARSRGGRVLAEVAAAHGATARQVALAFLVREPGVFTIPKAARAAHVVENAAAGDLVLSDDDARRIDAAFPRGPWRGLPTL